MLFWAIIIVALLAIVGAIVWVYRRGEPEGLAFVVMLVFILAPGLMFYTQWATSEGHEVATRRSAHELRPFPGTGLYFTLDPAGDGSLFRPSSGTVTFLKVDNERTEPVTVPGLRVSLIESDEAPTVTEWTDTMANPSLVPWTWEAEPTFELTVPPLTTPAP